MFARYFFIFIGIISLLWIGYVAVDIIDKKNVYTPSSLFGVEDGEVLIINRKNEVDIKEIPFNTSSKNTDLLKALLPNLEDERSIYISKNRNHILIESKFYWSQEKISTLLASSNLGPIEQNRNSYSFGEYIVHYHKNLLYFQLGEIEKTTLGNWEKFDKKASASLIKFQNGSSVLTDIYFKDGNTVEYSSLNNGVLNGKQINDKDLFSYVLPKSIDNYHFTEKNFLASKDKVFQSGPMFQWMDKGFVSLRIKDHLVLVSDYIAGQDPINVLFDLTKKDAEHTDQAHFSGVKLTESFPKNEKTGFYIYTLNDFVVISESQAICEEIIKENKLGNTLATNNELLSTIYSRLPKLVSERVINSEEKYSRTVFLSKILETKILSNDNVQVKEPESKVENTPLSISMNVNETINDFIAFNGKGYCQVLTESNELLNYENGKLAWKKKLPGKSLGKIQHEDKINATLITTKHTIHLIDHKGNYSWGDIIDLQGKMAVQAATFYQWKGKNHIACPTENGEILIFDANRKLITVLKSNLTNISAPVDVWISQNKLFIGVRNASTFKMFDVNRKKEYRSFNLPGECLSVVKGNELKLYTSENQNFISIDQKGNKTILQHKIENEIIKTEPVSGEIYFINKSGSNITVFNSEGKKISGFKVDFSDIENIQVKVINGKNYISIIDGLENNVYLYQLNGKKVNDSSLEGSKKCTISSDSNNLILTTIVDNYLIQYLINF